MGSWFVHRGPAPRAPARLADPARSRPVFDLVRIGGIHRIDQLFFTYDGVSDSDVFVPLEYTSYRQDFESTPSLPTAGILERRLVVMRRIIGRFYDREWFSSRGMLCTPKAS
ncbi:hypothetical protein ACIBIZ_49870 [Nonomuraea spiralis]|uniref:hypothetical protein n=1 Tax=Nonomuraea spiralis TaxID=46182 RepID=UPI0037B0985D